MATKYLINSNFGIEVELKHDLDYYCPLVAKCMGVRDKLIETYGTKEVPTGFDLGKVYRELAWREIERIMEKLFGKGRTKQDYSYRNQKRVENEIVKELQDLYYERKKIVEQYYTSSIEGKSIQELQSMLIDTNEFIKRFEVSKKEYQLKFKSQILTNAYAILHKAETYQIVNISYNNAEDDTMFQQILMQTKPDIRLLNHWFTLSSERFYDGTLKYEGFINMLSAGMIPDYGVISSMSIFGYSSIVQNNNSPDDELNEYKSLFATDLLDPYNDTYLPQKETYLKLDSSKDPKLLLEVRKKLRRMIQTRETNTDIMSIVLAAWCCDYLEKYQYKSGDKINKEKLCKQNDIIAEFNLSEKSICSDAYKSANSLVLLIGSKLVELEKDHHEWSHKQKIDSIFNYKGTVNLIKESFPRFFEHFKDLKNT